MVTKTPCNSLNRATASSFSLSPLARKTSIITSIGILYLHILTTWFWGVYFFGYNHNWNTIHLTLNRIMIIILRSHLGLPRNVGGIRVAHRLIFGGVVFLFFILIMVCFVLCYFFFVQCLMCSMLPVSLKSLVHAFFFFFNIYSINDT